MVSNSQYNGHTRSNMVHHVDCRGQKMKKIAFLLFLFTFMFILWPDSPAKAQQLDFSGLRPSVAEVPEYTVSVGLPLPHAGVTDINSLGELPSFIKSLSDLKMPDGSDTYANLLGFMENVNAMHGKNVHIEAIALPVRILGINTKWFELRLDGGVANYTTFRMNGLENKLDLSNIRMDEDNIPYVETEGQRILELKSRNLLGGTLWAIVKTPIKVGKYTIIPMAGLGLTLAYSYSYTMSIDMSSTVKMDSGFSKNDETKTDLLWAIHGMVGLQFNGFKYLRPRIVLQFCGRPMAGASRTMVDAWDPTPAINFGIDLKVWKIATLRAEVRDFKNPEYRTEISRKFFTNSEVAIGGVFKSKLLNKDFGYAMIGLGGEPIKATTTILFDKNQVGVLFGVILGYMPQ